METVHRQGEEEVQEQPGHEEGRDQESPET
jgi:hypothetical protein